MEHNSNAFLVNMYFGTFRLFSPKYKCDSYRQAKHALSATKKHGKRRCNKGIWRASEALYCDVSLILRLRRSNESLRRNFSLETWKYTRVQYASKYSSSSRPFLSLVHFIFIKKFCLRQLIQLEVLRRRFVCEIFAFRCLKLTPIMVKCRLSHQQHYLPSVLLAVKWRLDPRRRLPRLHFLDGHRGSAEHVGLRNPANGSYREHVELLGPTHVRRQWQLQERAHVFIGRFRQWVVERQFGLVSGIARHFN